MTGFGAASPRTEEVVVTVEVRTVNHRFLDLHIRTPKEHAYLEKEIQSVVRGRIVRGRVDVSVNVQRLRPSQFRIDPAAVRGYLQVARQLQDEFGLDGTLDLKTLLGLPGVLQLEEQPGTDQNDESRAISEVVMKGLRDAVDQVLTMRVTEGKALGASLLSHLESIGEGTKQVRALAHTLVSEYRQRLQERMGQLLPLEGLDPQRLAQEVALFADRSDISEELARLESHLQQFAEWLSRDQEMGKKMDFLLQEMQREVTTILSKTSNLEITRRGIAMKADVERLREQIQNVE